jgi:hypothetical protein
MLKWLLVLTAMLVALGAGGPWLRKLGLGRLPGDIRIEKAGKFYYFPITSSIIVSLLFSLLLWISRR